MYVTIAVTKEMKDRLELCKEDFLRHHPEFRSIPISYNKILYEVTRFYLEAKV